MARLRAANPFDDARALKDWSQTDEDGLLDSLLAEADRSDELVLSPPDLPPSKKAVSLRRFKRPAVVVLIGVAAGATVLGVSLGTPSTPNVLAAWSATTTSSPATQLAAAHAGCQRTWTSTLKLIPPARASGYSGTLPPLVLTDSRGPFEMLVYAGTSGESVCLWKFGLIGISGSNGAMLPATNTQSIGVPGVGFASDRGSPYTYAFGTAGSGVKAITLVLTNGTRVDATVQHGLYGAWWPSKTDVASAQVSAAAGTFHQQFGDIGPDNNGPPENPPSPLG
jgi:hypothetical protein